jgi:HEAT repeat protein
MGSFDLKKIEKLKARKNVRRLLKALDDPDYQVSAAAAEALGEIGDARAVWPLIAVLRVDKWYMGIQVKRKAVAKALGEIGDPNAVKPLIEALLGLDISEIKPTVAEALGKIGDPRAVWPLIATVGTKNRELHKAATGALRKTGVPDVETLINALSVQNLDVRIGSAELLGLIGDPRAVKPLITSLKDENSRVREAATGALGNISSPESVTSLIATLKDEEMDVRKAAATALGKLSDLQSAEHLIAALSDQEGEVRKAAAKALGNLGDPRFVPPLIAALRDEYVENVRWTYSSALAEIGAPAVEPLFKALRDKNSRVREGVVRALDHIELKSTDEELSIWFYIAKGEWSKCIEIGAPAVEPLIAALKYEDLMIRAAQALGEIGDLCAVEPLIAAFKDKDWSIRKHIAQVLGRFDDPRAVNSLIAALRDKEPNVRVQSTDSLVSLGASAVDPLITALKHKNKDVRIAAAKSLVKVYKNARLNAHQKNTILALRGEILGTSATHHDRHSDECCLHNDHSDNSEDIVKFPL